MDRLPSARARIRRTRATQFKLQNMDPSTPATSRRQAKLLSMYLVIVCVERFIRGLHFDARSSACAGHLRLGAGGCCTVFLFQGGLSVPVVYAVYTPQKWSYLLQHGPTAVQIRTKQHPISLLLLIPWTCHPRNPDLELLGLVVLNAIDGVHPPPVYHRPHSSLAHTVHEREGNSTADVLFHGAHALHLAPAGDGRDRREVWRERKGAVRPPP